jgi:peptidoglycan/LPS O-acetylase OafA/YrhL
MQSPSLVTRVESSAPAAATDARSAPAAGGYIPALDGLRAVSIALVTIGHTVTWLRPGPVIGEIAFSLGEIGVSVFFVVSGYLITMLLLREEAKTTRIDLRAFYIRRVLRIFPAAYAFQIVVVALAIAGLITGPPHDYIAAALYVRNLTGRGFETSHLWSLSLEEQFYLAWPFLLRRSAPASRLRLVVGLIAAVVLWRCVAVPLLHPSRTEILWRTDLRIDTILVGCALALFVHRAPRVGAVAIAARSWLDGAWVFWAAWLALFVIEPLAPHAPAYGVAETTVMALLIMLIVRWTLVRGDSPVVATLRSAPFRFVGRLSYSLYLWQPLFIGPPWQMRPVRVFPLNVALAIAAALGSYYLIERPFLRIKDRFSKRPAGPPL